MNTSIRQIHRWLSIAFTATVIANFAAMGLGEPPAWVVYSPLFPLFLLLFSGLYMFVLPYAARWRSGSKGTSTRALARCWGSDFRNREGSMAQELVNVRYMVNDVQESVDWYKAHFGFEEISNAAPAFADVKRGALRLLLSGEKSSAGRPMPDGQRPVPGGWNRFELVVARSGG